MSQCFNYSSGPSEFPASRPAGQTAHVAPVGCCAFLLQQLLFHDKVPATPAERCAVRVFRLSEDGRISCMSTALKIVALCQAEHKIRSDPQMLRTVKPLLVEYHLG